MNSLNNIKILTKDLLLFFVRVDEGLNFGVKGGGSLDDDDDVELVLLRRSGEYLVYIAGI